ncbi:MAG: ankyrin repeat domain-containing protein [Planctomycetota bacterium]
MKDDGTTAWIEDVRADRVGAVAAALEAGPRRVNTFVSESCSHGEEMWLPLHHAAEAGALGAMGLLLDGGGSPDCRSRFATPWHARATPLHLACAAGRAAAVGLLLARGASVEVRDALGRSPLHLAAGAGCAEAVDVLVSAGAMLDVVDGTGRTALHAAIAGAGSGGDAGAGCVAGALRLIEAGADVDARCPQEPEGFTPVHRCVSVGEAMLAVVEAVLSKGADTGLRDPRDGRTAAELAEALGREGYVRLLGSA